MYILNGSFYSEIIPEAMKKLVGPENFHEELVMSKMMYLGPGEGFSCLECEYISKMKSNIRHHVESKHLDLSYPCSACDKTQKSYKAWYLHMKTHNP